jgi:hypothetical protein
MFGLYDKIIVRFRIGIVFNEFRMKEYRGMFMGLEDDKGKETELGRWKFVR